MAKSLKVNFIYNILSTVSSLLFPLIAFSYASRIVMPDGIGKVQFFSSIINYIALFSSLGIPMYGIREIARVRDDLKELSKTTLEIVSLNLLLNCVGYLVVFIICSFSTKVQDDLLLFLILSSSIVLTTIGCSWFYNGVEDFKYITIVGIVVKILCLLFLFIFVKSRDDLIYYGIYTILGTVGCNIINFIRLRKYVSLQRSTFENFNIWRHIKPAAAVFLFNIITSIYINLDSVMLGFLSSNTSVGYYSAATKVSHVLVMLITSFGAVLLPRSSNLIQNSKMDDFYRLSSKSYNMIIFLAFPVFVEVFVCAPSLIVLFCGSEFHPAIMTLRVVSPIILALGLSNLLGIQILYPLGKIEYVTISTGVGALMNVILNLILIPKYHHNGAAIATLVAESCVTLTQCILVRKLLPFSLFDKRLVRYALCSLFMYVVCGYVSSYFETPILNIIIVGGTGIIVYLSLMLMLKDDLCIETLKLIKNKA